MDSEKKIRALELVLVLSLSFLPAFLTSLASFCGVGLFQTGTGAVNARLITNIALFLPVIAVLLYVVRRSGTGATRLGLSFRWPDVPVSLPVLAAGYLAAWVGLVLCVLGFILFAHHRPDLGNPAADLFRSRFTVWYLLFLIIDPVFEELIMRAYLITEVEFLTGSTAAAVAASTVLQASYHLYEGLAVIPIAFLFLVFSLYFARYRRIVPVILAHLLWDAAVVWLLLARPPL